MEELRTPNRTQAYSGLEVSPRQDGNALPESLDAQLHGFHYEYDKHQYYANRHDLEQQKHYMSPLSPTRRDYSTPHSSPSTVQSAPLSPERTTAPDSEKASPIVGAVGVAGVVGAMDGSGDGGVAGVQGQPLPHQQQQPQKKESEWWGRRRCGLAPGVFWTFVGLAVLLVVGGVVGGVVGALTSKDNNAAADDGAAGGSNDDGGGDGGGDAGSSSVPTDGALAGSRLAALSWDDRTGATRRAVFYQSNNEIFCNRRDVETGDWSAFSISAQIAKSDSASAAALSARNATPIAVVARPAPHDFEASLYFLDAGLRLRDLVSSDTNLATWRRGPLWDADHSAAATSDIAAVAFYCATCFNETMVVFQTTGGAMHYLDGRNWTADSVYIVTASTGTPLGMIPVPYSFGTTEARKNVSSVSLVYSRDGHLNEFVFNRQNRYGWKNGPIGVIQGFAGTAAQTALRLSYGPSNSNSFGVLVGIDSTGSVVATVLQQNGAWAAVKPAPVPTFLNADGATTLGGPSLNLSSLAMNGDFSLYAIGDRGKSVLEWGWGNANPYEYIYTSAPFEEG